MIRVDGAVFAAAQAGDPAAIDRVLRELQPDIRRYARRQCHRTSAIEDVVQEALIVLYRRLGNVRDPLAVAGWIFRVVTRLCMLPVLALIRGAEELSERHEAEHFAQVSRDELRIDLTRALESLPEMYREVNVAIGQQHAYPVVSVLAALLALVAMRGCPACWTIGLLETIQQRLRR